MKKEFYIKESLSGAFFVKLGDDNLGGFHKKEHAELFLKALKFNPKDLVRALKLCLPHLNAYCGPSNQPVINSESGLSYYQAKEFIEKYEADTDI